MPVRRSEPGPSSITWTGVNSFSGATASFSNQNPGNYAVSCTINGIDTRSTTVTVRAPDVRRPPPPTAAADRDRNDRDPYTRTPSSS